MAAAAHKIQITVTDKVPLGNGRALYLGTALGGAEYEAGGAALEEEATNSRFKLPERLDNVVISGLMQGQWVKGTQKYKLLANAAVTAKKTGFVEYEAGETAATPIPAGTPFQAIGVQ
jgi:hypothetical protein